jgi:hypothetical protein
VCWGLRLQSHSCPHPTAAAPPLRVAASTGCARARWLAPTAGRGC